MTSRCALTITSVLTVGIAISVSMSHIINKLILKGESSGKIEATLVPKTLATPVSMIM